MVQHATDGSISIGPSANARFAGTFLLVLGNLPAAFPIVLLVVYRDTANWTAVAVLVGGAVAWLVMMTLWQALNQPWTIHADAAKIWMTRRIWGRQAMLRSDLGAIRAASASYFYKYRSETKPTYYFVDRRGGIAASVKAADYARTDVEELARYLETRLKGDFDVDIGQQLKSSAL